MSKNIKMTRELTTSFMELQKSMKSVYVHIVVPTSCIEEKPIQKFGGTWYRPDLRQGFVHDRDWCHLGSWSTRHGPKRFALMDAMLEAGLRFCVRVDRRCSGKDIIFKFSNLRKEEEELLPEFFTR